MVNFNITLKNFRSLVTIVIFSGFAYPGFSQNRSIDVQSYHFNITLNDQTDTLRGKATIKFTNVEPSDSLRFDLVNKKSSGKGMTVDSIFSRGAELGFHQQAQTLSIRHKKPINNVTIYYHGVPADGLIISKNEYGDRTFFGDNWPNRAHNWLPCIDHPSDKATVEFTVNVPAHYQVISNGKLIYHKPLNSHRVTYNYASKRLLPTKVMVIGVANFAVDKLGKVAGVPLSSWVYPKNKETGFGEYAEAKPILKFYVNKIAPFPFAKLANVQSTTRYGGMENAGAIFYAQKSVNGQQDPELLLAHEIAHQWFGDSITETDWPQLWLSEGFATYFADLYDEHAHGEKPFQKRLQKQRQRVINFSKVNDTPVIDTTRTDLIKLLNPDSYQKGAWILHMLYDNVGDKTFWKAIRAYYQQYKFKNANSRDLQGVFEKVSGQSLETFFDQWLRRSGQPVLKVEWNRAAEKITVKQTQDRPFTFPLELRFTFSDGSTQMKGYQIEHRSEQFSIVEMNAKSIQSIELDPRVKLLFEKAPGQSDILKQQRTPAQNRPAP